ncbi:MAG: hypothetical protein HOP06_10175 [Methylotenera sp.]|nr:hypothetical protein [Methylotenera sp.]
MKAIERELKQIYEFRADGVPAHSSIIEALAELKELRKDQSRLDWLASTEQNIGNVMLPKECVEQGLDGGLRGMIDYAMSISSNETELRGLP